MRERTPAEVVAHHDLIRRSVPGQWLVVMRRISAHTARDGPVRLEEGTRLRVLQVHDGLTCEMVQDQRLVRVFVWSGDLALLDLSESD